MFMATAQEPLVNAQKNSRSEPGILHNKYFNGVPEMYRPWVY
jgi:hypothetical protein